MTQTPMKKVGDLPDKFAIQNWPEDFEHENGNYLNTCCGCGITFIGHKRRVTCKVCAHPQVSTAPHSGKVSRDMAAELEIVIETMGSCAGMTNKMLVEMLLKHIGLQIEGEN